MNGLRRVLQGKLLVNTRLVFFIKFPTFTLNLVASPQTKTISWMNILNCTTAVNVNYSRSCIFLCLQKSTVTVSPGVRL